MNPENVQPTAPAAPTPAPVEAPQPAPQPTAPLAPTPGIQNSPAPQPNQFEQPSAPAPVENPAAPADPNAPAPTPAPAPAPKMTYDQYLDSLVGDIKPVELPKPTDVPADDPDGLVKFFDDFGDKIIQRVTQEQEKATRVQTAEATAWKDAFTKYPEIESNAELRGIVHNIRMGAFQRNENMSPTEAADQLVQTLHNEYRKGQNDERVTTTVVASQPLGGAGQPAPQGATVNYEALHTGGRAEAVNQLEALIRDGKI